MQRGQAEKKATAAQASMFEQYQKGLAGQQAISAQIQKQMAQPVLRPEDEARRAAETMAGQQQQAMQQLQESRAVRTGDITARGVASAQRAMTDVGQRAMAGVRGEATRAAAVANRQAQQASMQQALQAQGQQDPYRMAQAAAFGKQAFYTGGEGGAGGGGGGGGGGFGGATRIFGRKTPGTYGAPMGAKGGGGGWGKGAAFGVKFRRRALPPRRRARVPKTPGGGGGGQAITFRD